MEGMIEQKFERKNRKQMELKQKINDAIESIECLDIPEEKKLMIKKSKLDMIKDIEECEQLDEEIRILQTLLSLLKNKHK